MKRSLTLLFGLVLLGGLVLPAIPAAASPKGSVVIERNSQFDAEHGVRSGSGTKSDPYVIAGWDLQRLLIRDTSKCVTIRNSVIGSLTLNWIGGCATVVKNKIGNLRVNENVKRTGQKTSGVIAHNEFGVVGQLRHYDGLFARNKVGAPEEDYLCCDVPFWEGGDFRAVNFDGFNGAVFRDNIIYGYVEARLHGHHHSSGFGEDSHYHGTAEGGRANLDHMRRYHKVAITRNTIYNAGPYALIYTDSAHAANDRTAASEQNEALNNPHMHWTRVSITKNRLVGAGIVVDIFNADDRKHLRTQTGHFTIARNKITLEEYRDSLNLWDEPPAGIAVWQAKDLHLHITGNRVLGPAESEGEIRPVSDTVWSQVPSGIRLDWIEQARIHISDNAVTNREVGIYARSFNDVTWWINGFTTRGVDRRIDYDNSSNPPRGRP